MRKICTSESKVLKLTNVLKYTLKLDDEMSDINIVIEQMQTYIRTHGAVQIGPLIQHTSTSVNENNEVDINIVLMLQCNNYIHNVESPYSMESVVRVTNCMYCRFIGPEEKLKLAYDKINVEAFEKDISLKGDNYTIFVDRNEDDETIVADVFMERVD